MQGLRGRRLTRGLRRAARIIFFVLLWGGAGVDRAAAQARPLLEDRTGDGKVTVMGFGDSITFGVGDDEERPLKARGYLPRLAGLLGIAVINEGVPGEELVGEGELRFVETVRNSAADVVVVAEGSNDAVLQVTPLSFRRSAQRMVNVARALGRQVVVGTVPIPVAEHESLAPFTAEYSAVLRAVAAANQVPLVDSERMWRSSCGELSSCRLLNIPEGLHPNDVGYTALAQLVGATLSGVDPFGPESADELASLFGIAKEQIVIVSDAQ